MATDLQSSNVDHGRTNETLPEKEITSQDTLSSILITNRDLLVWLREFALHPRGTERTWTESDEMVLKKTLHVRKCLFLDNIEHRTNKRTREQARSDGEVFTASGQSSDKSGDSNFRKKGRKLKSSVPCSPSCSSSSQNVDVSNTSSPKDTVVENAPENNVQDVACGSDTSSSRQKYVESLFGENEGVARPVIPVGPGFQAQIPNWIAETKKGKFYGSPGDSKTLRLLGTDVWPTYSPRKKTVDREVGKGRPDSCCCSSPRSTNCIRQHTKEAREILKADLGGVFYTWKFDKMGEVVSKSWTVREEQRFESLVKKNPFSSSEGFWGLASKAFPTKSKKTLLSYYYNVYLIKRMRSLTQSSDDRVDSDDDRKDDFFAG